MVVIEVPHKGPSSSSPLRLIKNSVIPKDFVATFLVHTVLEISVRHQMMCRMRDGSDHKVDFAEQCSKRWCERIFRMVRNDLKQNTRTTRTTEDQPVRQPLDRTRKGTSARGPSLLLQSNCADCAPGCSEESVRSAAGISPFETDRPSASCHQSTESKHHCT